MLVFGIRKRLGNIKTALIAGVLVLGVQVSNFSGGREISTQETSAGDRIESWNIGIHLLASHPLLGIGYGNYTNFNVLTAHNSYVLCFTELGLLGFFVWMALIVLGYQATNSVANTAAADTAQKIWGTSLRAALIGFLACAWFLSRTYQPLLYILLALCIAVRYPDHAALPVAPKGPVEVTVPWAKPTVVVCLVAIMAAYATIIMQRVTGH
jgi:O-antigen ligase